jgi:hypothetical protein
MCFLDKNVESAFLPARPEALKPYKLGEDLDLDSQSGQIPGFPVKRAKKLDM